jgi:hypothetical protein
MNGRSPLITSSLATPIRWCDHDQTVQHQGAGLRLEAQVLVLRGVAIVVLEPDEQLPVGAPPPMRLAR